MQRVRLRAVRQSDLEALEANQGEDADPMNFFGIRADNSLRLRHAADGLISEDAGMLAVESLGGVLLGDVSWFAVRHGPTPACRALNLGISLLGEHRGHGYGSEAQRCLVDHLLATTLVHRLEASTDIDNVAEQRSLQRAGFTREGVLRGAQYRAGRWHDLVLYSFVRGDDPPPHRRST